MRLMMLSLLSMLALLLAACGAPPAAQPTAAPAPTTAPEATDAPAPTTAPTVAASPEPTTAPEADAEPIKVVATYSILGDLVENVAGVDTDHIELTVLVGPGGDAHTYEPSPRDSATIAEADILFENGLEFESWIDDLYEASGSTATRIAVADDISDLIASEGHSHGHDHSDPLAHACGHFDDAPETVTADPGADAVSAAIPDDHTRYDIMLSDGAGLVQLSRDEDTDVSFFLGSDVAFAVLQDGTPLASEQVEMISEGCDAIQVVHTYDLAAGDYLVQFGPDAGEMVTLVWETAAHSHSEDEEHSHSEDEEHSHSEDEEHSHSEDEEYSHSEDEEHSHSEDEHGHSHGEYDPHVWHDPNNAMVMVEAIRNAMVSADPANADVYAINADTYLAQLTDLDAFIRETVAPLPEERRKLVTTHDTFGYFARQYDFEVVGTALGSVSTEAADPSAGEIADLVETIRAAGVPAIFTENVANPALMETIAREAGVELAPTLFTDALGEPGSAGETYLAMVRFNVTTMVEALSD